MSSNLRPNFQLAKNILIVIGAFFIALKIANFNNYLHAHVRGKFYSEKEAEDKSLELGCEGTHKNQDKWLPCKNEKELHRFLRKQMKKLISNKRKLHRKVAAISAIPLFITILSGTIYSFLQPLGIDAFWMIK